VGSEIDGPLRMEAPVGGLNLSCCWQDRQDDEVAIDADELPFEARATLGFRLEKYLPNTARRLSSQAAFDCDLEVLSIAAKQERSIWIMPRPGDELAGALQTNFATVRQQCEALCVAQGNFNNVFEDIGMTRAVLQRNRVIENAVYVLFVADAGTEKRVYRPATGSDWRMKLLLCHFDFLGLLCS